MKVSYNHLKSLLDFDLEPEALAEVLTDTGLEVEGITEYNGLGNGLEGLVIAEVESLETHPDADKLQIAMVNTGEEQLQIVCGAPNIEKGQKVVLATVNTTLYPEGGKPFKIKKSKIRGQASHGMICAEDEIGLGKSHDGIMVLNAQAPVGKPYADYLGIEKDTILEIGLTPNRSDAIGHIGVARDIAAALTFHKKEEFELKWPEAKAVEIDNSQCPVKVEIKNPESCPRYSGVVLENIEIGESPFWLKQRLLSLGTRPINNIVDITNYILHEFGQPLHAFDLDAVKGQKIVVQKLPSETKFTTLDEEERKLHPHDLMICNAETPMCIAGVFGGLNSGVKSNTNAIFLESAHFEAIGIRRTANRHLLRTDAAQKYEKSTDPDITLKAMNRAVELMQEIAGANVKGKACDYYPQKIEASPVELKLDYLEKLSGVSIPKEQVALILKKLDIEIVSETKEQLNLLVPPYRADVKRAADIVEEIVRIYGLNNIPVSEKMSVALNYTHKPDLDGFQRKITAFLSGKGFSEMVNNSITQSAYYQKTNHPDKTGLVHLLKSSNSELDTLRSNMLFPMLERIAFNLNRNNKRLKFFEFGNTYFQPEKLAFKEESHLTLAVAGEVYNESWQQAPVAADIYFLKPLVEHILNFLPEDFSVREIKEDQHYVNGLNYFIGKELVAQVGSVNPSVAEQFDVEKEVTVADISWTLVRKHLKEDQSRFSPIPKFPSVRRDLALLIDKDIHFDAIKKIATEEGKRFLKAVNLFDIYADKKLGKNKKSYAVSFVFQDEQRTLTDKVVDKTMQKLVNRFEKELSAELRS